MTYSIASDAHISHMLAHTLQVMSRTQRPSNGKTLLSIASFADELSRNSGLSLDFNDTPGTLVQEDRDPGWQVRQDSGRAGASPVYAVAAKALTVHETPAPVPPVSIPGSGDLS